VAADPVWRPRAKLDLLEIYLTIARNSPPAADRICGEIGSKVALLATYPRLGPRRRDLRANTRALVVRPYLVLYRTIPDTDDGPIESIIIAPVVDGRRHLPRLLR
jgi:toxin ParE1/3/4